MSETNLDLTNYSSSQIRDKILTIRNKQVLLDSDLAEFYSVETKRLNEQVKRNLERFPSNFMFQLTKEELGLIHDNSLENSLSRSQFATLKTERGKNIKYLPYAFTEQGVAMLSGILRSETFSILAVTKFY